MNRSYKGDLRLRMEMETEISLSEKIRRGVHYSPTRKPNAEILDLEYLRDQALAARITRAARRREKRDV